MSSTKYIIGVFDDEDTLKGGIDAVQKVGIPIFDVFTPYPVHGLHHLLHIPRSRLPKVAFVFGLVGLITGTALIAYTMGFDWPMDIGGKPHFPWPNYVPVTFELTVLLGSLGMAFAYFYVNGMYPGASPKIFDLRSTNDRFVMAIEISDQNNEKINNILKDSGVVEIKYSES